VNGPVAQGARAGEVEWARREGVGEVVADGGWAVVLAFAALGEGREGLVEVEEIALGTYLCVGLGLSLS
jgi:hypothetical protein